MNRKKVTLQAGFLVLVMGMTLYSLLREGGLKVFAQTLKTAEYKFIALALILLLGYIVLEAVIIKIIMYSLSERISIGKCMKYSFAGFFFYCISPAGSLEQPMQLALMHRDGVNTEKAMISLLLITITFKLSIVLLGAAVYCSGDLGPKLLTEPVKGFCIAGEILSAGAVVLFAGLLLSPSSLDRAADAAIGVLSSRGIIRKPLRWEKKKDEFLKDYSSSVRVFRKHRALPAAVLLITIIQRLCYFAITVPACLSIGAGGLSAQDITAAQGMVQLGSEMLPLPGGMGVNELMYLKVFSPVFGDQTLSTLILSRGVGYYCQLIICGLVTAGIWISGLIGKRLSRGGLSPEDRRKKEK